MNPHAFDLSALAYLVIAGMILASIGGVILLNVLLMYLTTKLIRLSRSERFRAVVRRVREVGASAVLFLFPYLRSSARLATTGATSTVAASAKLAKGATASTVAALMAMEERLRAPRAEPFIDESAALSDFEKLNAKYGEYRKGRQAVTVFDDNGQQRTLWMPPTRQPLTSNPHLLFGAIRTAAFIGFGVYLLSQMPAWMRPLAVAGVAGAGLLSHFSFNPLHWVGL